MLANNSLFVSFYVITPNKRVRPIFQPQRCTLTDPDRGVEHEYLLGNGSNDPRFLCAEFAPVEVAGTFACLINTSTSEVPASNCSGPAFTAADVTCANTLDLQDGVTYMEVHLSLSLPIPFGVTNTANGTVS